MADRECLSASIDLQANHALPSWDKHYAGPRSLARKTAVTMAHYPDLTPYEYSPEETGLCNVGWLGRGHDFPRGPVPAAFADELRRLAESPVNLYRGFHTCEFCQPPQDILNEDREYYWVWAKFRSGNGEVRVTSAAGVVFAAPVLVLHYVAEHQYRPPQEFIDAVLFHREQRVAQKSP